MSTNNGKTWHPAELSDDGKSFKYTMEGSQNINMSEVKSRAVDDSGNLENRENSNHDEL